MASRQKGGAEPGYADLADGNPPPATTPPQNDNQNSNQSFVNNNEKAGEEKKEEKKSSIFKNPLKGMFTKKDQQVKDEMEAFAIDFEQLDYNPNSDYNGPELPSANTEGKKVQGKT